MMNKKTTIGEVAARWKKEKQQYVKQSSFSAYELILENHVLPAFAKNKRLKEEDVQAFVLQKLQSGLSQNTVKDMVVVLKMIQRFGVKNHLLDYQEWNIKYPTERMKQEPVVFSIAHQRKLMQHIQKNLTNRNLGILICLNTGMRIGEVCALKWGDIDLNQDVIRVTRTLERIYLIEGERRHTQLILNTPKTKNSAREIPISNNLLKSIRPLKKGTDDNHYMLTNDTKPIEPRIYRKYFKRLLQEIGLPEMKFHGLRHSFATRCIESLCDYKTVSALLGHANISTTLDLYVHPNLAQKKKCINRMLKGLE